MSDDPVLIRQMVPGDLAYLMATGLRTLWDADPTALPDDLWFTAHRTLIERLLGSKSITALVACAADAPTEILGYVVAEPKECLWLVFVRKSMRRMGLCTRLLNQAQVSSETPMAFSTQDARKWLRNPLKGRQLRSRK